MCNPIKKTQIPYTGFQKKQNNRDPWGYGNYSDKYFDKSRVAMVLRAIIAKKKQLQPSGKEICLFWKKNRFRNLTEID